MNIFPSINLPPPLLNSGPRTTRHKSVRIRYGDGYQHSRAVGINSRSIKVPVAYVLDLDQRNTLISFLNEVGTHEPFESTYTGYTDTAWILDGEISEQLVGGKYFQISFTVENYFAARASLDLVLANGNSLRLANDNGNLNRII